MCGRYYIEVDNMEIIMMRRSDALRILLCH